METLEMHYYYYYFGSKMEGCFENIKAIAP